MQNAQFIKWNFVSFFFFLLFTWMAISWNQTHFCWTTFWFSVLYFWFLNLGSFRFCPEQFSRKQIHAEIIADLSEKFFVANAMKEWDNHKNSFVLFVSLWIYFHCNCLCYEFIMYDRYNIRKSETNAAPHMQMLFKNEGKKKFIIFSTHVINKRRKKNTLNEPHEITSFPFSLALF